MENDVLIGRIFEKFDHFEAKLDSTCNTVSEIKKDVALLKQSVSAHLMEREKAELKKERKFYVIMALMGVAFTIYEITKDLIS